MRNGKLGTEKAPQRHCVTKILPNAQVNFLVRFGSKPMFSWWAFRPRKKNIWVPPPPNPHRHPPGPSPPPPPSRPPPPLEFSIKNDPRPFLAPRTPPSPPQAEKKLKIFEASTKFYWVLEQKSNNSLGAVRALFFGIVSLFWPRKKSKRRGKRRFQSPSDLFTYLGNRFGTPTLTYKSRIDEQNYGRKLSISLGLQQLLPHFVRFLFIFLPWRF